MCLPNPTFTPLHHYAFTPTAYLCPRKNSTLCAYYSWAVAAANMLLLGN